MGEIRMGVDSAWVRIRSKGSIDPADGGMRVDLYGAVCRTCLQEGTEEQLAAWTGYSYYAVGLVCRAGTIARPPYRLSVEGESVHSTPYCYTVQIGTVHDWWSKGTFGRNARGR